MAPLIPPPPYSETDPGTSPHANLTPATSQADHASVSGRPQRSTASSIDETVYTPPYSPSESLHHNQGLGDDFDSATSTSAAAYFESRPAVGFRGAFEVVRIAVTAENAPDDLPYPYGLAARDVKQQDWATFVNYLLPDHMVGVNNSVADRKLKAELVDERMHRLTLGHDDRSRLNLNEVDAQLEPLRQEKSMQSSDGSRHIEATISEWNNGFFNPRGVQISTLDVHAEAVAGEDATRMPGTWIPGEDETRQEGETNNAQGKRPEPRPGFFNNFMYADSRGFKMGPLVADNNGFRIGSNGLRADHSGFRLGNMLVADPNGFRLGGSRGFVADANGVSLGGRAFGHGRRDSHDHERGFGRHGRGRHDHHGPGRGRGRSHSHGRRRGGHGRSSSTSSDSSSSSSSSSDSDKSVGSIQEYEDLTDQQLPAVKQSLTEWLNHPDQPITKETVQNMRQDIKYAKKNSTFQRKGSDLSALRKEVKDLTKMFKDAKKAQKKDRKEARKERKATRKAAKRERRASKKEERKARKEERRGCRPRGATPFDHTGMANKMPGGFPSMPSMPFAAGPSSAGPQMFRAPHQMPGFPFSRSASAPFNRGMPFGLGGAGGHGAPGVTAMHGGWPFTHSSPYLPGGVSAPQMHDAPSPIVHGAGQLHQHAQHMDRSAELKESHAMELRTNSTGRDVGEKEKLKMRDEATRLEEEAEKYRREADRLRAEGVQLDIELAREMEEEEHGSGVGQVSGVVPGSYVH